jgi:hypothetical protein
LYCGKNRGGRILGSIKERKEDKSYYTQRDRREEKERRREKERARMGDKETIFSAA